MNDECEIAFRQFDIHHSLQTRQAMSRALLVARVSFQRSYGCAFMEPRVHTYFFGVGGGGVAHQVQVVAGHYGFVGGAVGVVVWKHEKRHRNQSCAKQILRFIYLVFIGLCV